nr:immunoglobulin heavy chain junction region [Macaca mulatta]MOY17943.1 immunoglobulin heavy chain junction region [Macaca mulatta]MOY17988.1 immunoglobulin heavy chain junction region [Macaca mulatta]MOY18030.1 immunoglobulin heavy chain junction region [Macaca mulatta]MOY18124.1 immunoglobulin heavy chain junction region [Macaca mulatta]
CTRAPEYYDNDFGYYLDYW